MDNENIEILEENETTYKTNIQNNELGGEGSTNSDSTVLYDNGVVESPSDSSELSDNQSLEELLRQYFSGSSEKSLDLENDVLDNENLREGEAANNESSEIDYTEILNDLYDVASQGVSDQEQTIALIEEYNDNNTLQSSVVDISLSNTLLLYLCGCILFGAVLNFGRRIF